MKIENIVVPFAAVLLFSGLAAAVKMGVDIHPEDAELNGFSVVHRANENGTIRFVLSRDLGKARSFEPDSELTTQRDAKLRVYGDAGLIVEAWLAPESKGNAVVYWLDLAPEYVEYASITLSEVDAYKDSTRPGLIGGGIFYELKLAEFYRD